MTLRYDSVEEFAADLKSKPDLAHINAGIQPEQDKGQGRCLVGMKGMAEADFLEQIIELAHLNGWLVAHFRPAKTEKGWRTAVSADGKGFPDLVMLKGKRCLFVELKSGKGKLSFEQTTWLTKSLNTVVESYVWRPSDFDKLCILLA